MQTVPFKAMLTSAMDHRNVMSHQFLKKRRKKERVIYLSWDLDAFTLLFIKGKSKKKVGASYLKKLKNAKIKFWQRSQKNVEKGAANSR